MSRLVAVVPCIMNEGARATWHVTTSTTAINF
jgi:hypothetical protein